MTFVSWGFVLFLAGTVAVYYLAPGKVRWLVLLAASCGFYLAGGVVMAGYLAFSTVIAWGAGLALEALDRRAPHARRRRTAVAAAALALDLGMLFAVKYLNALLPAAQVRLGLLLPLGVSFFVLQTAGYVIDRYRGKVPAERDLLRFALFTSFFPQMVQGPIGRFDDLAPQLTEPHPFAAENLRDGIQLLLWGYLKKMVVADRAAVLVSSFWADAGAYGGAVGAFAVLMYSVELYCDFSGGIDIARGAARCFGVGLAENFRRPIFARSLAEFWRRWHITLGTWMRDYVFYPLVLSAPFLRLGRWSRRRWGGKPGKLVPAALATVAVYLLVGLWHGAGARYIVFGLWNGLIITGSQALEGPFQRARTRMGIREQARLWRGLQMGRTALIVFLGRYLTCSPSLAEAAGLLAAAVTPGQCRLGQLWDGTLLQMGLTAGDLWVVGLGTAAVLAVELYQERRGSVRQALARQNAAVQWLAMAVPMVLLLLLGVFRGSYIASEFIYRQF